MHTLHLYTRSKKDIRTAAALLEKDGIIAFPTETVYGLASRVDKAEVLDMLYSIKKRPAEKKTALLVPDISTAEKWVGVELPQARLLADAFWPGPITIVVPDAAGEFVGLRCPDCEPVLYMLAESKVPVTSTSANISGEPPAVNAGEVFNMFGGKISAVLDDGACEGGRTGEPSTVVRLDGEFEVLREGPVSAGEIARILQ